MDQILVWITTSYTYYVYCFNIRNVVSLSTSIINQHPQLTVVLLLTVKCVYGPLAKDVDGLVAAFSALSTPTMRALDPSLPPLSFNDKVSYRETTRQWVTRVAYHNDLHNYYLMVLILY